MEMTSIPDCSEQEVRWQYLSAWVDKDWVVKTVIWREGLFTLDKLRIVDFLNILGEKGWELISVLPVEIGHRLFMKARLLDKGEPASESESKPETGLELLPESVES